VAEHGVTEAELARAKGQMRGQTVLSYESPSSRMSRLGGNAVLGDERTLGEVLDRYDTVDRGQVRAAAAELFSGTPVLGLVGPRVPAKVLRDWAP
jgi:predicted Zn-dependent peptidase